MIRPQNFEEVVRLKRCIRLCEYINDPDDDLLQMLFDHLAIADARVFLRNGGEAGSTLTLFGGADAYEKTIDVEANARILTATLTATALSLTYPQSRSYSGGDSGISGNNNNNNNNNNNA